MPRPIDPQRHRERRLRIIDAGLTVFARHGYAGATTALICREAGISSGTFFHYFPTKKSLVLAILDEGAAESREFFAGPGDSSDAVQVVFDWIHHELADLADPRAAGFISVVNGLATQDDIGAALTDQDRATRAALAHWVGRAQSTGRARTDITAERLAGWVMVIVDGFAGRVGTAADFDVTVERSLLFETISALLNGRGEDTDA